MYEKKPYLKTSYHKWMIYVMLVFGVFGIGGIMAFNCIQSEDRFTFLGLGFLFGFVSVKGLFEITMNYEVLDGDILTIKRFFITKRINVKEIKYITINEMHTKIVNQQNKVFCMIDNMTKGLDEIIDALKKQGIIVEYIKRR